MRGKAAGGRTERKRERKLRGGVALTVEQQSRGSKEKRGEFRSVLWIMHAGLGILIHLWLGEREKYCVRKSI